MTIGQRLRKERQSLGLSQPKFASLAGTTKQTLFSWETDKTAPAAGHLAAFAAAGVDVVYVLTGVCSPHPTAREKALLDQYRRLPEADQKTVERTLSALAATAESFG